MFSVETGEAPRGRVSLFDPFSGVLFEAGHRQRSDSYDWDVRPLARGRSKAEWRKKDVPSRTCVVPAQCATARLRYDIDLTCQWTLYSIVHTA